MGLALLTGCGQPRRAAQRTSEVGEAYLAPPTLASATHAPGGAVQLMGSAPAGAEVRLRSPDGSDATVKAGGDGAWAVTLPPADTPRLYAFEARVGARVLKGEGALAVLPPPEIAALVLRGGYAALPPGSGAPGRLELIAFDYDGGGAAVVGVAAPGSPVRFLIDGGVVGAAQANSEGRFAMVAVDPRRGVAPGVHTIRVEAKGGQTVERRVEVKASQMAPDRAYVADRDPNGWALSWRTPGGGLQTSLVFDPAQGGVAR